MADEWLDWIMDDMYFQRFSSQTHQWQKSLPELDEDMEAWPAKLYLWCLLYTTVIVALGTSDREDFWVITGWDPSVCKSNRLHVHILQFSFVKLGYIL